MGKAFAVLIFIAIIVLLSGGIALLHVGKASGPLGTLAGAVAFIVSQEWYERYGRR